MHVAVTQVHPVGECVGELGRDRPDLAAQPAEVVEQSRALCWQFLEQACEAARQAVQGLSLGASA